LNTQRGKTIDGEADFIVAAPSLGVCVIEVKGGAITFDGRSGRWHSGRYQIGNPVEQVRRNMYALRQKVRQYRHTRTYKYSFFNALCFPDVRVPPDGLNVDTPRAFIIDSDDLENIKDKLDSIRDYWLGKKNPRLTVSGVNALTKLIARSWRLHMPLLKMIERTTDEQDQLTEQQFQLLDFLGRRKHVLIEGCAGSGKTLLAAEKARRLADQGFCVALLCWNKKLAKFLKDRLKPYSIKCITHIGLFKPSVPI